MKTTSITPSKHLATLSQSLDYFTPGFREKMLIENPKLLHSMIRVLELAIRYDLTEAIIKGGRSSKEMETICRELGRSCVVQEDKKADEYAALGRRILISYTEAEWSTMFARDRLLMHDLGMVSVKDGDLTKTKFLTGPEQVLNLLRWKQFRDRPETISHILSEIIRKGGLYSRKFFRRLGEVCEEQPFHFPDHVPDQMQGSRRELQTFLLDNWVSEWTIMADSPSEKLPPLFSFSNQAMFDLLVALAERAKELKKQTRYRDVEHLDEAAFAMVWRRLGLRKDKNPSWTHVQWDHSRRTLMKGIRLTVWDRKPGKE